MITPPCSTPGCKQPSVHRVDAPTFPVVGGVRWGQPWYFIHLCVPCYERKVWGKA